MRRLYLLAAAGLVACSASAPSGQPASVEPAQRTNVFEHTFNAPGPEKVRVDMTPGTYRAETTQGGVRLTFRPLLSGVQPPTIRDVLMGRDASGGGLWEVEVHQQGTYEIEVVGGQAGQSTVLRIYTMTKPAG